MKISDLDQPRVGDIVEFETDPETVVEGVIVGETEDGYIYEFSDTGYTELHEACTYGKYYCSTDKKYKCRTGPKQSRTTEAANAAQQAAIAIAKKKKLKEFAPGAGGDDGDADPYRYPKPELYRRSIDFFGKFEADHFDREDMNDTTGEFKGYWGSKQIAYFKFDNPQKTGSDDPGMGWYYEPETDDNDDNTSADPAVDNSAQRKQQELGIIDAFLKSGQKPKPGSQIYSLMKRHGVVEEKQRLDPKCWDGYKKDGTKMKGGVRVNNCVKEASGYIPRNSQEAQDPRWSSALTGDVTTSTMREQIGKFFPTTAPNDGQEQIREAEYQGREVPLGRPMRGDVKKFKVYVKDPSTGNVKKVNFGDPNMRIKKSNPARRKSFRARHNCKSPGPRTKARYWSCRKW